jgi:tRNA(Arg) A34 adenosine deaminase TadA
VINDYKNIPTSLKYDRHCLHFAAILIGHKIIATYKCSLAGTSYICNGQLSSSAHAEINVLKSIPLHHLKNKRFTKKIRVYVIRFDYKDLNSGVYTLLDSQPCWHCLNTLNSYGVNKVYYSMTNSKTLVKNQVKCLLNSTQHFYSSAARRLNNLPS